MHGPEESDSVIVAVKPTNKAEHSVAEPVEPRTETKGTADQQSTRRAQDGASVSQALERVRQAARQRKKERFTSLLHHVDPAMLRTAFYAMKRDAAPGVDGMTWETYEQDLDRRIETLHARVQAGTYRALPSRRSYIPKEDGSKRPLAVALPQLTRAAAAPRLSRRKHIGQGSEEWEGKGGAEALYQEITDKIVAELEQGRLPWVQPWAGVSAPLGLPRNAATSRPYSGISILILWCAVAERGFTGQKWLTFCRALALRPRTRSVPPIFCMAC